jgi:hypothetical protein
MWQLAIDPNEVIIVANCSSCFKNRSNGIFDRYVACARP